MRIRPIHHTFGPHVSRSYALQTDILLLTPWRWKRTESTEALRTRLQQTFRSPVYLFASGREGLLALLRSLRLEPGAEIIIQGYTCVALPNAIHAAGCTPVYADIDKETLNLDPNAVQGRITNRTRAVLCQHTFGIPANTKRLKEVCREHNLILIEDCAHVLPDSSGPKEIGREGDYIFTSFGRDKVLSGITGGVVIARSPAAKDNLAKEEKNAARLSNVTIARLLMYAPVYHKTRLMYGLLNIGKLLLMLCGKLGLLVPVITEKEKTGAMSPILHRIPEPCSALAGREFLQLSRINDHRRRMTKEFLQEAEKRAWKVPESIRADLPMQKFPIFVENPDAVRAELKKKHMYLDDGWSGAVVCPRTVDQEATNYIAGSCPHAEQVARSILNLPTHPTMTQKQTKALLHTLSSLLA